MRVWWMAAALVLAAAGCDDRTQAPAPAAVALGACESARDPAAKDAACSALLAQTEGVDDKTRSLAHSFRGGAKRQQGDVTSALRDFRAALELDAENRDALMQQAAILIDSGQLDAAEPLLARAVAQQDSANAQLMLGRIALIRLEDAAAIERFNAALAQDSRLSAALSGRARAKERLEDEDGALDDYNSAIALQSDNAEARAGRCWMRLRADENLNDARADAAAAVAADPRLVAGQMCRGLLQLKDGEWEGARASFNAVLEVEGGNPDAIYGRGFARKRAGDRDGDEDIDRAIAFDSRVVQRFRALDIRP